LFALALFDRCMPIVDQNAPVSDDPRGILAACHPRTEQTINRLIAAGILERIDQRVVLGRGRPPKLYRCPAILDIVRE
jgi:hypothetical protein